MLEKLKALSAKAKIGIASGAVLLAAAGVGLGVTQPWNQPEPSQPDPPPVQQPTSQGPAEKKEPALSVRAGNEVVPCTLYEGDGWSIYLPENWTAQKEGNNNALLDSGDGAQLSVSFLPGSDYAGSFVNLSNGENERDLTLQFFQGIGEGSPSVSGSGPESRWDFYSKLFIALARTLTVGDEKPFGEVYIIPQKPDWQKAEGKSVLFLDKDGYIMDDKVQEAVEDYMQSWPQETRANYTGQYRVNGLQWAGSYTGITEDGYIDVFRADAQYRVAEGGEEKLKAQDSGMQIVNGWTSGLESVYLAVSHDGGSVDKTQGITTNNVVDWASFAGLLN